MSRHRGRHDVHHTLHVHVQYVRLLRCDFIYDCNILQADELTDKELLFSSTSIADWIIPAIYMGHIGSVVWLKPPWALQIAEGQYSLVVGRDRSTGYIRLGQDVIVLDQTTPTVQPLQL